MISEFRHILLLLLQVVVVFGNTEKVIFLAPDKFQIPTAHPTIKDLHLEVLTPRQSTLRTHIQVQFPTDSAEEGASTWLLLDQLQAGQRYEVRICWSATQPTSFRLNAFELSAIFGSTDRVASLAQYSATRQPNPIPTEDQKPKTSQEFETSSPAEEMKSILFLQILSAADYYTVNKVMMEKAPPVYVDIILDPFLLNIFPRSLVPTAIYLVVLAIGSWFLSKQISNWILIFARQDVSTDKKKS